MIPRLRLKPGEHRVLAGSPWVYRGELPHAALTAAEPGSVVEVEDVHGRFIGRGFFNPASVIAVRLLTRAREEAVDAGLIRRRLAEAAHWRRIAAAGREAYRVVNAESDGLPGLIVDRYGRWLVVEVLSLGMAAFLPVVLESLVEHFAPAGIYERGESAVRAKEGLPLQSGVRYGEVPEQVLIHEYELEWTVNVRGGQKTGHYLDQYANRLAAAAYAPGRAVFDVFCHSGSFGLLALARGADSLVGVDIDADAVNLAAANARRNRLDPSRWRFEAANAFDWLRHESDQGPHYDLGILDPPAFTKSPDTVERAVRGYKEINLRALKLLRPGGVLVTSSCSYHLSPDAFLGVLASAAHDARRRVRVLEWRGQGPDHPYLPALPETRYLKCAILAVD
ncbi:LSU m5C1962 methyltransferase RlmI [Candidatus Hydrogenisulfobacillus filiaventi]|uniref:LSU m5C1962 methyltransferase RlmI n=1 Tax=Candidatus Hydrogenisulfobacillus filiaventi TaxID=2707344 RepID=A0A6F8ZK34_9FIRM|nr:LSU m5C1962 methyltransferase RlmI [Candidatus Hydrogenisulfobacillus filiaventi]